MATSDHDRVRAQRLVKVLRDHGIEASVGSAPGDQLGIWVPVSRIHAALAVLETFAPEEFKDV